MVSFSLCILDKSWLLNWLDPLSNLVKFTVASLSALIFKPCFSASEISSLSLAKSPKSILSLFPSRAFISSTTPPDCPPISTANSEFKYLSISFIKNFIDFYYYEILVKLNLHYLPKI